MQEFRIVVRIVGLLRHDPGHRGQTDIRADIRDPLDLTQQVHEVRAGQDGAFIADQPAEVVVAQDFNQVIHDFFQRFDLHGRLYVS